MYISAHFIARPYASTVKSMRERGCELQPVQYTNGMRRLAPAESTAPWLFASPSARYGMIPVERTFFKKVLLHGLPYDR
jgi:hypothetical protein